MSQDTVWLFKENSEAIEMQFILQSMHGTVFSPNQKEFPSPEADDRVHLAHGAVCLVLGCESELLKETSQLKRDHNPPHEHAHGHAQAHTSNQETSK